MCSYSNRGFGGSGTVGAGRSPSHRTTLLDPRYEVLTFQAYNKTFVGDNGEADELFLESCPQVGTEPRLRSSLAGLHRPLSFTSPQRRASFHRQPYRSGGRGDGETGERRHLTGTGTGTGGSGVPTARRSLGFEESSDSEYVDSPEERLGLRQSPLGSSGSFRPSELRATPSKRDRVVLAPMIADAERYRRELASLATATPSKCLIPRQLAQSQSQLSPAHRRLWHQPPTPRAASCSQPLARTPPRRAYPPPNCAVISPNWRGSTAPLLSRSPGRGSSTPPLPSLGKPSARISWANLPTIHLPTEMLCCVGFILLSCGAASILLAFYILAVGGRRYFLDFGAVAGFTSLTLGMLSCRTNKWKWLPHRNYLSGYIMLSTFSLLETACLGGIIYALTEGSYALLDTLGGAVCALSILLMAGSLVGVVTSHCCHRPPPDNRVAHSAAGFTV